MNLNKLKKLSGDASYRIFFRNKIFKASSVVVYCKKQNKIIKIVEKPKY